MPVQVKTPLFLVPNRILLFGQTYLWSWNSSMDDFRCCNGNEYACHNGLSGVPCGIKQTPRTDRDDH